MKDFEGEIHVQSLIMSLLNISQQIQTSLLYYGLVRFSKVSISLAIIAWPDARTGQKAQKIRLCTW